MAQNSNENAYVASEGIKTESNNKSTICLCIIFNHNYEENVPLLRQVYRERFSKIIFLMPFYQGNEPDIFPYYEQSYYFQASINQSYQKLNNIPATHFVFIADDLFLNPIINQDNVLDYLGGRDNIALSPLMDLSKVGEWSQLRHVLMIVQNAWGMNWRKLFTGQSHMAHMAQKIQNIGFDSKINMTAVYRKMTGMKIDIPTSISEPVSAHQKIGLRRKIIGTFYPKIKEKPPLWIEPVLPCVGGYSDIFVIPRQYLQEFAHYAGVTAAMNLFVEIAIPTIALMISPALDQIAVIPNANNINPDQWTGIAEFTRAGANCPFAVAAGCKLSNAFKGDFAKVTFYHPIKLSKDHTEKQAAASSWVTKWQI